MSSTRPRFSVFPHFYLWAFFMILAFLPVWAMVAGRQALLSFRTLAALAWPLSVALLYLYARRKCSSEHLPFHDGLLRVAACMMTGWTYLSFVVVLPALLSTFSVGVLVALYGDIRRKPKYAQTQWYKCVHFFYRHRMMQ